MNIQKFFIALEKSYNHSEIKLINKDWYYSLCTSIPKIGQPLLIGFNWVADGNNKKQTSKDLKTSVDWNEMGSLEKVKPYLEKYFINSVNDYNQTNYCFFKSKTENQISHSDIELSEPIFFNFIAEIKPKYIVSFSAKLRDIFLKKGLLKYYTKKTVFDGKKNICVYHGFVKLGNFWTYIYFLPHPSYWNRLNVQNVTLDKLWDICRNTFPYEIRLADFLNYLESIEKAPELSENPLNEDSVSVSIFTHNQEFINISNISFFQFHNKELQSIKDFDINDMTAILECYSPKFDKDKFENYLNDKRNRLSINEIIKRNFDTETFEWSYNIVKIGLQKLYIYSKYFEDRVKYLKLNK